MNAVSNAVLDAATEPQASWQIDWNAPWLAALKPLGQQAHAWVLDGFSVADALQAVAGAHGLLQGWRFVGQEQLAPGLAYEAFIHDQRCIPTRNNLHDFFNGLIWLYWPRLKQQLNHLQATEIARQGVGAQRGRLRDAITVLDENGGLLLAPQALCDALREKRWQDLFVQHRALWVQAQFLPIGHALLEKLVQPRKAITAHVICWPLEQFQPQQQPKSQQDADAWLCALIQGESCNLASKPYLPIPILGIPGWCHENQNFSFYDDSLVFRAPRTAQTT